MFQDVLAPSGLSRSAGTSQGFTATTGYSREPLPAAERARSYKAAPLPVLDVPARSLFQQLNQPT
jgi:hypothetical protein